MTGGDVSRRLLPVPPLPPGRPRLVVTGMMGSGKTVAGRLAAAELGLPFFDLDEVVERRAGMPVAEAFARLGEPAFRSLESRAVRDAARLSGAVVATGGGAVLDRESFAELARGSVVAVLAAEPEELARRVGGGAERPLLHPDPLRRLRELARDRAPAYAAAGERVETTGRSPEDVARELADRYRRADVPTGEGRVAVEVGSPAGSYRVLVGPGTLEDLALEVRRVAPGCGAVAVVADRRVGPRWGRKVRDLLEAAGLRAVAVEVPPGEEAKSLSAVGEVWERLREAGLDRTGVVVAVGGGATLDAAGFAAATYARGVGLVNCPTTLLAMVDAAVGGKVGIDHAGVKNLVGAFHHPLAVVADPSVLATLPVAALRWGLAEAVKAAVVASPLLLEELERGPRDGRGIPAALPWVVEQAVRIKAAYASADPFDRSVRASLNLGHTFAHAVESATGYGVPHGEAVAMGLVAAARLGAAVGATDGGLADRLRRALAGLGLPVDPPEGLDPRSLLGAMGADKKRRSGRAAFVVPAPEGVELVEGLDPPSALAALIGEGRVAPVG